MYWLPTTKLVLWSGPKHEPIMALITQPYPQDACGIGSAPISALGWAEDRFGGNFVELKCLHQIASTSTSLCHPIPQKSPPSLLSSFPNCRTVAPSRILIPSPVRHRRLCLRLHLCLVFVFGVIVIVEAPSSSPRRCCHHWGVVFIIEAS